MDEDIEKEGEEKEEAEPQPAGKFPLKWIIIGVVVLVLAGGGYVGWTMLNPLSVQTGAEGDQAPDAEAVKEVEVGAMFDMDPFVVNLNEAGGKRYLKAKIEIEFVVRPEGKVVDFGVNDRHYRTGILKNCMTKVFNRIRYPSVGGSNCPVTIPITTGM